MDLLRRIFILAFQDKKIELEFRIQQHVADLEVFKEFFLLFLLTSIGITIQGILFIDLLYLTYGPICFSLILSALILGKKSIKIFELSLFLLSLVISTYFVCVVQYRTVTQDVLHMEIFCMSTIASLNVYLLQLGTNVIYKMINFGYHSTIIILFMSKHKVFSYTTTINIIAYTLCIIYYVRLTALKQRKLFVLQNDVNVIEDKLIRNLNISCIRGQSNHKQLKLEFQKANKQAQHELQVEDQKSFLTFLRLAIPLNIKSFSGTFEKYLFDSENKHQTKISQTLIKIRLLNKIYSGQVIYFSDKSFWIILSCSQSEKLMKYKKIINIYRQSLIRILKLNTQSIKLLIKNMEKKCMIHADMKYLRLPLYQIFSNYVNLYLTFTNQGNQNKISQFYINSIFVKLMDLYQAALQQKQIQIQLEVCDIQLNSNKQLLQQLLFQLFEQILRYQPCNSKIMITVCSYVNILLGHRIITIEICSQLKHIDNIGLVNFIIQKLGPYKEMKKYLNSQTTILKLSLFQDLRCIKESPKLIRIQSGASLNEQLVI